MVGVLWSGTWGSNGEEVHDTEDTMCDGEELLDVIAKDSLLQGVDVGTLFVVY